MRANLRSTNEERRAVASPGDSREEMLRIRWSEHACSYKPPRSGAGTKRVQPGSERSL